MIYQYSWQTVLGPITAQCQKTGLMRLYFAKQPEANSRTIPPILKQTQKELEEYFNGRRISFSIPLAPIGTEFQKKVWQALTHIPYGYAQSYGDIAQKIGQDKACRAVGSACAANPILIFIPCHRVRPKSGNLGNFSAGIPIKAFLADLERSFSLKELEINPKKGYNLTSNGK